ncbi:tyrosine-type recombinase/integrase [Streptomyces sp. NPDC001530]|uniref:tyrosine-type recombinase/integrase n=1 Tax=Streptomyces sp. NPDC001530 TaxID=3364582 RepID=UPI0036926833
MAWGPREMLQEWLEASTYPLRVRENYRRSAERWLIHCTEEDLAWGRVAAQHIALWAHEPGTPHRSTAQRVSAVRSFYAYAVRQNALPYNPAARGPRLTSNAQLTPSRLDPWQAAVLLATLDERRRTDSPQPQVDRVCGYLQVGLGLRSAEILRITLNDLLTTCDIAGGSDTLRLYDSGGHERLVRLPALIRDAVQSYLPHRRRPRDATHGGPLLTSRAGIKIPHRYPSDLLRDVATASGLLHAPPTAVHRGMARAATDLR